MKDEEFSLSIKYADDSTLLVLDFEKLQVATLDLKITTSMLEMGYENKF